MSSPSVVADDLESRWETGLSGEVVDGITDGVVARDDSLARAEVVAGLVAEIVEAVRWRRAGEAGSDEIASLERLAAEAQAHRDRMRGAARTLGG